MEQTRGHACRWSLGQVDVMEHELEGIQQFGRHSHSFVVMPANPSFTLPPSVAVDDEMPSPGRRYSYRPTPHRLHLAHLDPETLFCAVSVCSDCLAPLHFMYCLLLLGTRVLQIASIYKRECPQRLLATPISSAHISR